MREKKKPQLESNARQKSAAGTQAVHFISEIVENAEGPIFSLDRHYCYTSFNRAHAVLMKTLYGMEIELGHSLAEYITVEEDWLAARRNIDRALDGEAFLDSAYSGAERDSRRFIAGRS